MRCYFDWGSDLDVIRMKRFLESQDQGIKIQNDYSRNPFKYWERCWNMCEKARTQISQLIQSSSAENVVLTQGTMAGLIYILDALTRNPHRQLAPGCAILTTNSEFPPLYRQLYPDFNLLIVKIDQCSEKQIISKILHALNKSTLPVGAMLLSHVLYRNGTRLPLETILASIRKAFPEIIIIIDGAQAVGHIYVNVSQIGADFYVGDFHKWIQGPNFTGFIHCGSEARVNSLAQHATHPMAYSRKHEIEKYLCSKFGPLPFAFNAIPSALKGFFTGEFVLDSFKLAKHLISKISTCKVFSKALHPLAPLDLHTGMIALELDPQQKGLRKRLFDRHNILVSEHWPQIDREIKTKIPSKGFLRISCSDNWNTKKQVEILFEALRKEWRKK